MVVPLLGAVLVMLRPAHEAKRLALYVALLEFVSPFERSHGLLELLDRLRGSQLGEKIIERRQVAREPDRGDVLADRSRRQARASHRSRLGPDVFHLRLSLGPLRHASDARVPGRALRRSHFA